MDEARRQLTEAQQRGCCRARLVRRRSARSCSELPPKPACALKLGAHGGRVLRQLTFMGATSQSMADLQAQSGTSDPNRRQLQPRPGPSRKTFRSLHTWPPSSSAILASMRSLGRWRTVGIGHILGTAQGHPLKYCV